MYFDSSSQSFTVESTDVSLVNSTYEIEVFGYIPDGTYNTTTFKLSILPPKTNNTPNIDSPPKFYTYPKDIRIPAGNTSMVTLPRYYDLNPLDSVSISYKL